MSWIVILFESSPSPAVCTHLSIKRIKKALNSMRPWAKAVFVSFVSNLLEFRLIFDRSFLSLAVHQLDFLLNFLFHFRHAFFSTFFLASFKFTTPKAASLFFSHWNHRFLTLKKKVKCKRVRWHSVSRVTFSVNRSSCFASPFIAEIFAQSFFFSFLSYPSVENHEMNVRVAECVTYSHAHLIFSVYTEQLV